MNSLSQDERVRPSTAAHIGAMIRIAEATNLSPWSAQNYFDELKTERSIMLCLENSTCKIIGFIVGRLVPAAEENKTDAEIYNIAVHEHEQGKGKGRRLLDAFLERCQDLKVGHIWLEVRESNERAIKFYIKNGFEQVQKRPNFYQNPREHALLMCRNLK